MVHEAENVKFPGFSTVWPIEQDVAAHFPSSPLNLAGNRHSVWFLSKECVSCDGVIRIMWFDHYVKLALMLSNVLGGLESGNEDVMLETVQNRWFSSHCYV